jgi:outer membrane receptor protein involved in Fe transport
MATWQAGPVTVDLLERYYGPLHPGATPVQVFDSSVGNLPAWFQTDIGIALDLDAHGLPGSVFLNVSNLLDAQPGIFQVPSYTGSPGMNYPVVPYEDIIGRTFTLGLRVKL